MLQEMKLVTDALRMKNRFYLSEKGVDPLHEKNLLPFCRISSINTNASTKSGSSKLVSSKERSSMCFGATFDARSLVMRSKSLSLRARLQRILQSLESMAESHVECTNVINHQPEEDISLTCCYCTKTPEAREISELGKPHVHCPCSKCNGRATWRMTAWRHLKQSSTQPTPVKKARKALEEPECSPLEPLVEYEEEDFDPEHVFRFAESYSEFPHSNDVCAGPEREDHEDSSAEGSSAGIDSDDDRGPSDDETGPADSDNEAENLKKFVQDSILRLVEMKQKMGCSINHFEELLQWGKHLHTSENNDAAIHWPRNWDDVQTMLKELGFSEPKHYWICFSNDHSSHYGLMESKDEPCPHCGHSGTIPYYYLGLPDKVKKWCSSPEMCEKMTAHWSQRDHWLPDEMKDGWGWPVKHEIWDGTRFAYLASFWDPNAVWTLPVRCTYPGCNTIICATEIIDSPEAGGGLKRIKCSSCGTTFHHSPREACGDPRNIAYCGKF